MKKVMKRFLAVAVLMMFGMAVSAQVKVDIGEFTNGTITATQGEPAEDGSVVVTLTVTPGEGYYIAKTDITVVLTRSVEASGTRDGVPYIEDGVVELTGDDPANLSDKRDYTFTVPAGLGAWVKAAQFQKVEEPKPEPEPEPEPEPQNPDTNISADGSNVVWNVAEGVMTISGDGGTKDFTGESVPWADIRSQITSVVIEKGVTSLGANIFAGCSSLTSIRIDNAATVLGLGEGAIPANKGLTVTVPANLLDEYNITAGWKELTMTSEGIVQMSNIAFSANNQYDTYVSNQSIMVPSVLQAFAVTDINSNGLVLTEVDVIQAGVPVLVFNKRNLDKNYYYTAAAEATRAAGSLLKVAPAGGQEVKLGEVYILYNDVFYYSQAGTIPAGNIYLPNKPSSPAVKTRGYYSLNGDGTTAIDPLYLNKMEGRSVWYTLDGHQLPAAPTKKGLYIKDGKKVIIK